MILSYRITAFIRHTSSM